MFSKSQKGSIILLDALLPSFDVGKIIASVHEGKIIAIMRGIPEDQVLSIADALYEG